ncbi:MAG TPA: DUF222 domain-containing protein, partial [Acidimicrobiales bacterium]|nr:DUF222 domain-containing protein [Acidimicrobiales bacterium]
MVAVLDVEAELVGVVDALCAVDPARLADGETVVALHRQLERLSAVLTRAVAAFDAGRAWDAEGARSASAWLAVRWNVPQNSARRRVVLGRSLREMPLVEQAWLAGDIGEAQVSLFGSARTAETAACFERDEKMLVNQAVKLGYRSFVRALAYWGQLADPEGTERSAARQHADRHLHLSQSFGGGWALEGFFD